MGLDTAGMSAGGVGTQRGSAKPLPHERRVPTWLGVAVVAVSILMGLVTYTILTGLTPLKPSRDMIVVLLGVNLLLVLFMAGMIAWQVYMLWQARRQGIAGARLHVRIVSLFGVVAALPALVVAVFATVTLNRGLDTWFSERTRQIVDTAVTVAQAYVTEHSEVIRGDVASIAADLNRQRADFDSDRQKFTRRLATHVALRGLAAAYIIDSSKRRVDASVTINDKINFQPPPEEALRKAETGELVVIGPGEDYNVIRALLKLSAFDNAYLYVLRLVNPKVVEHLQRTEAGKAEYDAMQTQRYGVQVTFALMYVGVAFIFLLAAIWFGLWVADRLVQPIMRLVDAARQVSLGELDVKVPVRKDEGDLATLGRTFNRMTSQLASQHNELINANVQLDERRRFTEAVLSGVSAGVIGLDREGRITLVNRSALALLSLDDRVLANKALKEVLPDMAVVLDKALSKRSGTAEGQVDMRVGGQERHFVVRATTERAREDVHGYVVTFDDITELVAAQRNSAWADIARRIAHEIKNPLTPIQLSAERLRRKYGKEIQSDTQVFEQCTDTIIRQVGDIGRMIDEFSSFARMPKALLEPGDLGAVVKEATILQRVSSSDIAIDLELPDEPLNLEFDRRLVTQAITNLVKNAREAVETHVQAEPELKGRIVVSLYRDGEHAVIDVADNGIGLPEENRQRLLEPYMTTREKGTGLGLAIVARIMEEHGGTIVLHDAPEALGGALVRLVLPMAAGPRAEADTARPADEGDVGTNLRGADREPETTQGEGTEDGLGCSDR